MQQKRTKGKGEERRGERRTGERREERGEESEVARLQRPFGGCFPATLAPGNSDIAGTNFSAPAIGACRRRMIFEGAK